MPRREPGFALLIVLWSLVLLTVLGTAVTAAGRGEARLALNIRRAAAVEAVADGAVMEAVFHLVDVGPGHWPADGTERTVNRPGVTVRLRLDSEAGRLNLNTAQPPQLEALLRAVGTDAQTATRLAAAVVAWRYPGAPAAELAAAYRAAGKDYAPPQQRFQTLGELDLVLGITPDLAARLRPHLTVFHDGDPDPLRMDPAVRAALGNPPPPPPGTQPDDSVVSVTAAAAGPDGTAFTRHAVVLVGAQPDGTLFRIVAWDRP